MIFILSLYLFASQAPGQQAAKFRAHRRATSRAVVLIPPQLGSAYGSAAIGYSVYGPTGIMAVPATLAPPSLYCGSACIQTSALILPPARPTVMMPPPMLAPPQPNNALQMLPMLAAMASGGAKTNPTSSTPTSAGGASNSGGDGSSPRNIYAAPVNNSPTGSGNPSAPSGGPPQGSSPTSTGVGQTTQKQFSEALCTDQKKQQYTSGVCNAVREEIINGSCGRQAFNDIVKLAGKNGDGLPGLHGICEQFSRLGTEAKAEVLKNYVVGLQYMNSVGQGAQSTPEKCPEYKDANPNDPLAKARCSACLTLRNIASSKRIECPGGERNPANESAKTSQDAGKSAAPAAAAPPRQHAFNMLRASIRQYCMSLNGEQKSDAGQTESGGQTTREKSPPAK